MSSVLRKVQQPSDVATPRSDARDQYEKIRKAFGLTPAQAVCLHALLRERVVPATRLLADHLLAQEGGYIRPTGNQRTAAKSPRPLNRVQVCVYHVSAILNARVWRDQNFYMLDDADRERITNELFG